MKNYWIQKAKLKKGTLSRQLGIPIKKNILMKKLDKIIKTDIGKKVGNIKVTRLLKRRAVLAINLKRM